MGTPCWACVSESIQPDQWREVYRFRRAGIWIGEYRHSARRDDIPRGAGDEADRHQRPLRPFSLFVIWRTTTTGRADLNPGHATEGSRTRRANFTDGPDWRARSAKERTLEKGKFARDFG